MQSNLPDEDRILETVKFVTVKTRENKNQMYGNPLADLKKISPPGASATLIEGNERFTHNLTTHKDLLSIANTLRERQQPFAAVPGCGDSRTTELIFDQSLGGFFSIQKVKVISR